RVVHFPARAGAARISPGRAGARAGAHDPPGLRHRVRLLSAHSAHPLARDEGGGAAVFRRADQWYDWVRGGRRPGCGGGNQCGASAARPGARAVGAGRRVHRRPGGRSGDSRRRRAVPGVCLALRPGASLRALLTAAGVTVTADVDAVASAEIELKYEGYLAREKEAAARLAELAAFALPLDLPYLELKSLATEARQKLDRIRPTSLAQAARIPGVSPSDLHNLVVETARWRRRVA